jgi:heme-degrading monooxygenase HmoA
MIVRVFRARVRTGSAADFEVMLREQSIPLLAAADGLVSWWAGRPLGETGEFVVVTVWRDLESLQDFAGPDWQREGVIPADELPLLEGTVLHHYEVLGSSS